MGLDSVECFANIYLAQRPLTTEEHCRLMALAGVHLCPSLAEGFGHTINQARSISGLIITTDAPPMNELIDETCGILVPTNPHRATTMAVLNPTRAKHYPPEIARYAAAPVGEVALMAAIRRALKMPQAEKAVLCAAARARYDGDRAVFIRTIANLI
jgi:hypothetical protein